MNNEAEQTAQEADLAAQLVERWPRLRSEPRAAWHWLRAETQRRGGPIDVSYVQLAAAWQCEVSSVYRRVASLEKQGLIRVTKLDRGINVGVILPGVEDVPPPPAKPLRARGAKDPQKAFGFEPDESGNLRLFTGDRDAKEAEPVPLVAVHNDTQQAEPVPLNGEQAEPVPLLWADPGMGGEPTARAPADVDVRRLRSSTSDVVDHEEISWKDVVDDANRVVAKIWPDRRRPLSESDRSLILKTCYLARTRMSEHWLWDSVEAVVRTHNQNPAAYFHKVLANKCRDKNLTFNGLLKQIRLPERFLVQPQGAPHD